jgi:hypothetical protein
MNNPNPQESPGHSKPVTITVNGRSVTVTKDRYTYEEIVAIAFPSPDFANNTYKVTYFKETEKKGEPPHERTLTPGESVNVKDGMVFTVVRSIKS